MINRPEIDGLRAIAVLAVLLFHVKLITGGYLGVDIFFIISGYLISSIILTDLQNNTFSFAKFYERRARRILPALLLVTLASVPFAWWLMDARQLIEFAASILAVEFFVSNFWFMQMVDYYSLPTDLMPLLHTWSLAVEEQYYLLYPLLVFAIWKFYRSYLLQIFIFLVIASLLLSQYLSLDNPDFNFYMLPSRVWELMLGAVLALLQMRFGRNSSNFLQNIMPAIGLLLILISMWYFPRAADNPNMMTLIPAFGTMAILWFGGRSDVATYILSSRVLVGIGLISYSMYLWHQPILAYMRLYKSGHMSNFVICAFIIATTVLSYLSWRFVEVPFRNATKVKKRSLITYIVILMLTLLVVSIAFIIMEGFPSRSKIPQSVIRSMEKVPEKEDCHYYDEDGDDWYCKVGNIKRTKPDFVIYGDSHVESESMSIDIAAQEAGLLGILSFMRDCPAILGVIKGREQNLCRERNAQIFDLVKSNNIKTVMLVGIWSQTITRAHQKNIPLLNKTIKAYTDIGVNVVILLQPPIQRYTAMQVYKEVYSLEPQDRESALRAYSLPARDNLRAQQSVIQVIQPELRDKIKILDPTPQFCDKEYCMIGTLDDSYYSDDNHLSSIGSLKLYPVFLRAFQDLND